MPGAPVLLQANRRHTNRHLLDGNAGSAPSNDLENCCWVSPSPNRGLAGPFLFSSATTPACPSFLSPALEAPSDPGRPPAVLASSSPSPLSICCHCCISRPARWFPALDVEKWERRELASHHPGSYPCPGPHRAMNFGVSCWPGLASPHVCPPEQEWGQGPPQPLWGCGVWTSQGERMNSLDCSWLFSEDGVFEKEKKKSKKKKKKGILFLVSNYY